jgi:hypothetical protein
VSARIATLIAGSVACAVVLAQVFIPGRALFHTWQYALALGVLAYLLISYVAPAMRGSDGPVGKMVAIALLGMLIVVADGLASGLLGPDTETIARAPGTIAPLPEIGAAAFFAGADPSTIESGHASVTLRRRGQPDIVIPSGARRFFGALLLQVKPRPAAYIDATDASGNHLTITQQTSGAFLSPVLLFQGRQPIMGQLHPVDGFQLPGVNRNVKAIYFDARDLAQLHVPAEATGRPALLYDVFATSSNKSLGITLAPSGEAVQIAGVVVRATLGTYPELVISSAPEPYMLFFGLALFVFGLAAAGWRAKRMFVPPAEGTPSGGDTLTWLRLRSRLSPTRQKSGTSQD